MEGSVDQAREGRAVESEFIQAELSDYFEYLVKNQLERIMDERKVRGRRGTICSEACEKM